MRLTHIALPCSSEENSDRFYRNLLGLDKTTPKTVSADLMKQIFQIDAEFTVINYLDARIRFEVFIPHGEVSLKGLKIEHTCLEIRNLPKFLETCRDLGVAIIQVPKGDKQVTFIKDFDGNLFEITETPA